LKAAHGIDRLPSYKHCHDSGFSCACRKFKGKAHNLRVSVEVRPLQVIQELLCAFTHAWRNLRQPNGCLGGLYLAKEGAHVAKLVVSPMLQETCRLRRHPPLGGVFDLTPIVNVLANSVNGLGVVVLLFLRR
jgi:hypothetical protein